MCAGRLARVACWVILGAILAMGEARTQADEEAGYFFAATPCRVFDTRLADGPALVSGVARQVSIAGKCGVPAGATAVALSMAVTQPSAAGHLQMAAAGQPVGSTAVINFSGAQTRANNVILPLSADGKLVVQPFVAGGGQVHTILDVTGFFGWWGLPVPATVTGPYSYKTIDGCRLYNSIHQGGALTSGTRRSLTAKGQCGVPASAKAVAFNVSAVQPTQAGHLVLYPGTGAPPATATVNFPAGANVANGGVTALGSGSPDLSLSAYVASGGTVHGVVDLNGYFWESSGHRLVTMPPCRAADTRTGTPLVHGVLKHFAVRQRCGIPDSAKALVVNATAVGAGGAGHLTLFPAAGSIPPTSTLNFGAGEPAIGNGTIVKLGDGGWHDLSAVAGLTGGSVHLVLDVFGYFEGSGRPDDFYPEEEGEADPPDSLSPVLARGLPLTSMFEMGDFDNVNLFNGALSMSIPIGGSYPLSSALSYGLTLSYNSRIWNFDPRPDPSQDGALLMYTELDPLFNAGPGWTIALGGRVRPPGRTSGYWTYIDKAGGEHLFYNTLHEIRAGESEDPGDSGVNQTWTYTRDGSYLRLKTPAGGKAQVEHPDGSIETFEDRSGRLLEIRDRFANWVRIAYSDDELQWTIIDSHGRNHLLHFAFLTNNQSTQPPQLIKAELEEFRGSKPAGSKAQYEFGYGPTGPVMLPRHIRHAWCGWPANGDNCPGDNPVTTDLLTNITLPADAGSYSFSYYQGASDLSVGAIKSATLPTGGSYEWNYQVYRFIDTALPDPTKPEDPVRSQSDGVAERTTHDRNGGILGTWKYELASDIPPPSPDAKFNVRQVTDPLGHFTLAYFNVDAEAWDYGLPYSRHCLDASGNEKCADVEGSETRFLSTEVYLKDARTPIRSTFVRYEADAPPPGLFRFGYPRNLNTRPASELTVYHDDANRRATVVRSDFDGLGHYRNTVLGGTFPAQSQTERTVREEYNPARRRYDYRIDQGAYSGLHTFQMLPSSRAWILGNKAFSRTTEGSSSLFTAYCYSTSTGALERQRVHKSGACAERTSDVLDVFTVSGGNVTKVRTYGGDATDQALTVHADACSTTPADQEAWDTCTMALKTPEFTVDHTYAHGSLAKTMEGGLNIYQATIDPPTGKEWKVFDPTGLETELAFDGLGRLTSLTPNGGGSRDGGATLCYRSAGSTASVCGFDAISGLDATELAAAATLGVRTDSSGSTLTRELSFFDALGRRWRHRREVCGIGGVATSCTWNLQETLYNGSGLVKSESNFGAAATGLTEYLQHDPFGRPRIIRPADGSSHDLVYEYLGDHTVREDVKIGTTLNTQNQVTEATATTSRFYDRFGRLWKVTEPAGWQDANTTTTYEWEAGDRLRQVKLEPGGGVEQCRRFGYDGRGFLLWEDHPELVGDADTCDADEPGLPPADCAQAVAHDVTLGDFNSRGSARWRSDAGVCRFFTFDTLNRLDEVRIPKKENPSEKRLLEKYTYGASGNSAGKLTGATAYNYLSLGGVDNAVRVAHTFAYDGRERRTSSRTTRVHRTFHPNSLDTYPATPTAEFFLGVGYDPLGNVDRIDYPKCQHAECIAAEGNVSRQVTFTHLRGLLTGVEQPATEGLGYATLSYHANGLLDEVRYRNPFGSYNLVYRQSIDSTTNLPRPSKIEIQNTSTGALGTLGPFVYDGAGNITQIGGERYLYDGVSRLKRGTLSTNAIPSLNRGQEYAYDGLGNLTRITELPANTSVHLWPAADTNRIPIYTYDSRGNVTYADGSSHVWDAAGRLVERSAPDGDWKYVYDAAGERIWSYRAGAGSQPAVSRWTLRGLSGEVLRVYTGNWSLTRDYVYRNGLLLASESPDQGRRYYQLDHRGTPVQQHDVFGNALGAEFLLPFGQRQDHVATAFSAGEPLRFTGHERDFHSETSYNDDLDYMHARFYNPLRARFLSPDPVGGRTEKPQSWNRYTYALNNPVNLVDPDGRCGRPAGIGQGQIGICIESFIAADRFMGPGFGDSRSFDANDSADRFRSSIRMVVDPQAGQIMSSQERVSESWIGITEKSFGFPGNLSVSGAMVPAGDGSHNLTIFFSAQSNLAGLIGVGPIQVLANLNVDAQGNVQVLPTSRTKDFPSIEGYAYRRVGNQIVVQVLFKKTENDPSALNGPMDKPLTGQTSSRP